MLSIAITIKNDTDEFVIDKYYDKLTIYLNPCKVKKLIVNCKELIFSGDGEINIVKNNYNNYSLIVEVASNVKIDKIDYSNIKIINFKSDSKLLKKLERFVNLDRLTVLTLKNNIDYIYNFNGKILILELSNERDLIFDFEKLKNVEYLSIIYIDYTVNSFENIINSLPSKIKYLQLDSSTLKCELKENIVLSHIQSQIKYFNNDEDSAVIQAEQYMLKNNTNHYYINSKEITENIQRNIFFYKDIYSYLDNDMKYLGFNSQNSETLVYGNYKFWKKIAERSGDSKYVQNFEGSLYKTSRRVKTSMSQFRVADSLNKELINQSNDQWNLVPVTRYALSQNSTLFFGNYQGCGTFYYLEKESSVMLAFKTYIVAKTKYLAYFEILKRLRQKYSLDYSEEDDKEIQNILDNKILSKPDPMVRERVKYSKNPDDFKDINYNLRLALYAYEDVFDDGICERGKELNIDVVIITDMIGRENCRVQEVYDLRDRIDSFRSLIYGFKCDENGHKLDENYIYQGEK